MPNFCTFVLFILAYTVPTIAREKMVIAFPNDSGFTCTLQVYLPEKPQKIYDHFLKKETSLRLIGSADTAFFRNGEIVTYFKAFNYQATTKTTLHINPDSLQLTMKVTSFTHNWEVVPKVQKGYSLYRFIEKGKGTLFIYTQEVNADRKLKGLHKFLIRWQLKPLAKQILNECNRF